MQNLNIPSQTEQHEFSDDYNAYLAYKKTLGKQLLVLHWDSLHCLWHSRHRMWRHIPGETCSVNLVVFDWLIKDFKCNNKNI